MHDWPGHLSIPSFLVMSSKGKERKTERRKVTGRPMSHSQPSILSFLLGSSKEKKERMKEGGEDIVC